MELIWDIQAKIGKFHPPQRVSCVKRKISLIPAQNGRFRCRIKIINAADEFKFYPGPDALCGLAA